MKRLATAVTAAVAVSFFGPLGAASAEDFTTTTESTKAQNTVKAFNSFVTIHDKDGKHSISTTERDITLGELLLDRELNPDNFRTPDNDALDLDVVLGNFENREIYQVTSLSLTEDVTLKAKTVKKKTDELYEGETEVKEKGKNGKAVKITVTETIAREDVTPDTSETLKVLEKPEPKVVLVGTAERPAPEPEPEPEPTPEPEPAPQPAPTRESPAPTSAPASTTAASTPTVQGVEAPAARPNPGNSGGGGGSFETGVPEDVDNSNKLVSVLYAQVGKPYVWGAAGPSAFDCSGFVYWVFKTAGYDIGRTTAAGYGNMSTPVSVGDIQPGDILWNNDHIAVYAGDGKVVHAANPRVGVIVTDLSWFTKSGNYKIGRMF